MGPQQVWSCRFAAVGPAGRRYRSIVPTAAGECGQCHVVSELLWFGKFTDLSTLSTRHKINVTNNATAAAVLVSRPGPQLDAQTSSQQPPPPSFIAAPELRSPSFATAFPLQPDVVNVQHPATVWNNTLAPVFASPTPHDADRPPGSPPHQHNSAQRGDVITSSTFLFSSRSSAPCCAAEAGTPG